MPGLRSLGLKLGWRNKKAPSTGPAGEALTDESANNLTDESANNLESSG